MIKIPKLKLNKLNTNKKKGNKIHYTIKAGPRTVKGSGDYEINPVINALARRLGGMGTSYLGLGSEMGSQLGDSAHRAFKAVTGYGDYKVKSNTLATDNGAPIFKPSDRVMHIRHREFIGDFKSLGTVEGSATTFGARTWPIYPTNQSLFPWLSTIARNFQQYRFKGLLFSFESKSGNSVASSNTALGTLVMATDYVVKPNYMTGTQPFRSKEAMEAHEFSTSTVPSCNMIHPIECAPSEQVTEHFNVLTTPLQMGEDPKFYVPGILQVATQGMQAVGTNLGELWVSYDIDLLKTRTDGPKANYHGQFSGNTNGGYLPPTQVIPYQSPSFVTVVPSTGLITFDSTFTGTVRLTFWFTSPSGLVTATPSFTIGGGVANDLAFDLDQSSSVGVENSGQCVYIAQYFVTQGGTLQMSNGYVSGSDTGTVADVYIDTVPDDEDVNGF